ncbi:VWA domain-containing protein [Mycobacterium sp. M1]|uniref:VWA domain-containing protein n=1 Tax=Mycolicibacter acidiphilus TaxID=2835306 RepID=A0ABS5RD45_9MYCO|nr:VWA domain-containing protein [Mycolicibacter acidiphilus]MBS9532200.1 VWA domain-containing protein [Mycolicibacter acidiphilus]
MTNSELSLIAALLDRSGSMTSIATDMQGGFDAFIAAERAAAATTQVTLAQFDGEYELVYADRPIADVPALALQPRGGTALLDSLARLITDVGAALAARPESDRPGSVTVLVMTDGEENSSVEWTGDGVRQLISQYENDYGWTFIFLGANMDAVSVGADLGFAPHRSLTWDASPTGVAGAFLTVTGVRDRMRSAPVGSASEVGFTEEDRRRARGDSAT